MLSPENFALILNVDLLTSKYNQLILVPNYRSYKFGENPTSGLCDIVLAAFITHGQTDRQTDNTMPSAAAANRQRKHEK